MMNTAPSSSSSSGGTGSAAGTSATRRRNSKRPNYSRFTQQEIPGCTPILTPRWVISTFMLVSIVFIPIGVACLIASRSVVEVVRRYDDTCPPKGSKSTKVAYIQGPGDKTCNFTITVEKRMNQPIYVYYQLENFHQNHRRYVSGRSDEQLRSGSNKNIVKLCDPEVTANNQTIVPCGLEAWSMFNDTYSFSLAGSPLNVNKSGISWKSDRDSKFGKEVYPKNFQNGTLIGGAHLNESIPLNEQEDLIVWMRTAALPTFRKLYGKIEVDLEAGDEIDVSLQNRYNTYTFDGKKKLVLSTASWLGGKNDFLGIACISLGSLCFASAITFLVLYHFKPRQLGDPNYLSWNRNPGGAKMS